MAERKPESQIGRAHCLAAVCIFGFLVTAADADFFPNKQYIVRKKTTLNFGWKFFRGNSSGASSRDFNDDSWAVVNVPHSASYDEPTPEGEHSGYRGVCWYRKEFTIDESGPDGRVFIEFEAAMQSAEVWCNGTRLGTHDNCGWTGFSFDVTDAVDRGAVNVLAVKLDNTFSHEIPPGTIVTPPNAFPDYFLFSGLYRDVWLISTAGCHIPLYGQVIKTEDVSASSARVRVKTTVRNDDADAVECTVEWKVKNPAGKEVTSSTETQTIDAGATVVFDQLSEAISDPSLWTPDEPDLYTIYTTVSADGEVVDDYVDRFGVRWFDISLTEGFTLNGESLLLKGVCLHQGFAWVENAVPNSRYFKEVELVKDMGANLIRCSHYPRDPSFYNACDEMGMLCMVEVPTWGNFTTDYPPVFWERLYNCVREMITVGMNHPSIVMWGLFNEPYSDYTEHITAMNDICHEMDPERLTYMAINRGNLSTTSIPDVAGLNYSFDTDRTNKGILNTEYHEGWIEWCFRGDANENQYANTRWNDKWLPVANAHPRCAGGCMWSFNDYWSPFMDHPMGVVDHYRVPKNVYYKFRYEWTGQAMDTPQQGTASKVVLTADLEELQADSTDISQIMATIRDGSGKCINAAVDVTFTVDGPVDVFGPLQLRTKAGRIAMIVKSTNTPGDITITAAASGLEGSSVQLTSAAPDTATHAGFIPGLVGSWDADVPEILVRGRHVAVRIGAGQNTVRVGIVDMRGRTVRCPVSRAGDFMWLDTRALGAGLYCARVSSNDRVYVSPVMCSGRGR